MQLYFLSFFLEVVVNVFDYFWKPNSLFSKICVNCLLMYYFVYCNNVFWKMLMEPVTHLLIGGPVRAWNVFLACED